MIAEAVYGLLANSLALLADAGHNLSDVLGLLLAWARCVTGQARGRADRYTYGMKRTPILASLVNAMLLLVASGAIAWEAVQRFSDPAPVAEMTVIWVALIGIVINGATALGFMAGRKGDLNIRGAFLHMVADAVGVARRRAERAGRALHRLAVGRPAGQHRDRRRDRGRHLVAAEGLDQPGARRRPVATSTGRAIEAYLNGLPGVSEIHDLHIWAMSTTEVALTAHLVRPGATLDDGLLRTSLPRPLLPLRHRSRHAADRIRRPRTSLPLAPAEVV